MFIGFTKKILEICAFFLLSLEIIQPLVAGENFENMVDERGKSFVCVKYIIQLEEDRRQIEVYGTVYNDEGVILLPQTAIPSSLRLSEMKDFRVYFPEGDDDGYEADFLGMLNTYNFNFIKLRKLPPKGMLTPISKFERGSTYVGDEVWGFTMDNENYSYARHPRFGKIIATMKMPTEFSMSQTKLGFCGSPVFDKNGALVGFAVGNDTLFETMKILDNPNAPLIRVSLTTEGYARSMMTIDCVDRLLSAGLPKNPDGDKCAWLGVTGLQSLKKDVAQFMGMSGKSAFVISDVLNDSPAQKAGLKKGDIVVGMDGKPFDKYKYVNAAIGECCLAISGKSAGDKISLTIVDKAGAKTREVDVVLGENPKTLRQVEAAYFPKFGFSVREFIIDDAIARRILDTNTKGTVVKFVKPNSPASSALPARLEAGDVIKEINSQKIGSYEDAQKALSKLASDSSIKEIVLLVEDFSGNKVVRINLN